MIGRIIDTSGTYGIPSLAREADADHAMFDDLDVAPGDVLDVAVDRVEDAADEWVVSVSAMEFVRGGDLYRDIHAAFDQRVRSVASVRETWPEDTETWMVVGTPDPAELLVTVAELVDEFAPRIIDLMLAPDHGGDAATARSAGSHAIVVHDDSWQCSCGAGGHGNWGEVVPAARSHDKETKRG